MSLAATGTPAEIDTELARLYAAQAHAAEEIERGRAVVARIENATGYETEFAWNSQIGRAHV
jgi:hypothetical protein